MAECFRLEPYDGSDDLDYAWVDDEDYQELRQYPWTDDATFDDHQQQIRVGHVFYRQSGQKYFLHREVWNLHEDTLGSCEGKNFGWINGSPRHCTKDNLYIWDPGVGNKKAARIKKLTELHERGIDVSKWTRIFDKHRDPYASARQDLNEPVVRTKTDPETFDLPPGAPPTVKAIRTVNDTLVYVDAKHYEQLAQYDWRDTGERVIRGRGYVVERLAQVVLDCDPNLLIGYMDSIYTHCWEDNLFAYEKGLANKRAAKKAARERLARR